MYLEFSDDLFQELMGDPAFALVFYRSTSKRTYHMYRKTLSLNLFSLEENAAFYFLMGGGDLVSATLETMSEEMGMSRRSLCAISSDGGGRPDCWSPRAGATASGTGRPWSG